MFKGSANVSPESTSTSSTRSAGASTPPPTSTARSIPDLPQPVTGADPLMEADSMRSLNVTEENFVSERDVVKEERRLRIENPPFGRLFEVVLDKTFTTHPYRILPIGSMADLNAATIEDVREFHRTYYIHNNATLVVAGDFDGTRPGLIEKHFARSPRRPGRSRANVPKEPAQTAERRTVEYDANTPLPAVILTYHMPSRTPRHPALQWLPTSCPTARARGYTQDGL